jgi:hypothetical protein
VPNTDPYSDSFSQSRPLERLPGGIEAGAPEARQVTDRWHLLLNLTQVLEEYLLGKRSALKKVALSGTGLVEKGTPEDGAEDSVPSTRLP